MKLKHNFKKPFRYMKQYFSIHVLDKELNYWWSDELNKWLLLNPEFKWDYKKFPLSNFCNCKSVRSFRKHLHDHKELPKGTHLVLIGRYVGQNVYGKI